MALSVGFVRLVMTASIAAVTLVVILGRRGSWNFARKPRMDKVDNTDEQTLASGTKTRAPLRERLFSRHIKELCWKKVSRHLMR